MRYADIPKFTRGSPYSVDVSWGYLEDWIADSEKDCASFELDPEFQRHHVWDDVRKSRYVEYILRGGRSSKDVYFNCANYTGGGEEGPMQLVDGKQRIDAVRGWLRNETPAFGIHRRDMVGRLGLVGPSFKVHVNNLQTHAEVLQWYLDLNEGGVAHTDDELQKVRQLLALEGEEDG